MITTTTAEATGRSARSAGLWTLARIIRDRWTWWRRGVLTETADSAPRLKMCTVPDEIVERQRWYERVPASDLEDEYSVICLN